MANTLEVTQAKTTFSVYRETFLNKVVKNDNLSKKDLRLLLLLMTSLPGYNYRDTRDDPGKYEVVHTKAVADALCIKKKDVEESLENLYDRALIEKGSSDMVKDGWRLTF